MNKYQVKEKWLQIEGWAKQKWEQLTVDDFRKAEGSLDKLCGVVEKKFGDTKSSIDKYFRKMQREPK